MANENRFYIERRPEGDRAVRRGDSERASAITPTEQEAIEEAKKLDPDAAIDVEPIRDTESGRGDEWREQP